MAVEKERIGVTFTRAHLDILDHLVESGFFFDRQIAIRAGVRLLAREYGIPPFYPEAEG